MTTIIGPLTPCPNCGDPVIGHALNDCALNVLIDVVRERGTKTEDELLLIHANTDVDDLWSELGLIIDDLEEGRLTS